MDLNELFATNVSRCNRWHADGIDDWSPLEWAGAMAGEAGEATNAAKKLKRLENNMVSINVGARHYTTLETARREVAKEVADTILYALLLMKRIGVDDPASVVREVFNQKSEEYGFPERV